MWSALQVVMLDALSRLTRGNTLPVPGHGAVIAFSRSPLVYHDDVTVVNFHGDIMVITCRRHGRRGCRTGKGFWRISASFRPVQHGRHPLLVDRLVPQVLRQIDQREF